jgi:hypothetical protein
MNDNPLRTTPSEDGYIRGLERALAVVESVGKFGLEKVVLELKEQLSQFNVDKPKE